MTQKVKIWNSLNFDPKFISGQEFSMKGKTVPDMTLSLKEIRNRYAQGLPIQGNIQPPQFNDAGDGIDIKTLDLHQIHELKEVVNQRIVDLKASAKKSMEEAKIAEDAARVAAWKEFASKEGYVKKEQIPMPPFPDGLPKSV